MNCRLLLAATALAATALAATAFAAILLGAAPAAADEIPPKGPFVFPENVVVGPASDSDRLFLERVRQAGLWEIPTGQQAQQRAANPRVREVGRLLAIDHTLLDEDVRKVAERLGVPLPSQATADQQRWMAELSGKSGTEYDVAFAQLLRSAHGAVFSVVAQVRAGSRNPLIRAFAQHTVDVVHRHMHLLESTGDVNYAALPEPVIAKASAQRAHEKKQPLMYIALLAVAGAIAVTGVARALRGA